MTCKWCGGGAYHVVQNLITNDSDHLKALLAADAVDNHVSMNTDEVLAVQDGIFVLLYLMISNGLPIAEFSSSRVPVRQCR